MAGSSRYTAILDACVLFSRLHRDILLSLAHANLYTARWTHEIEKEWTSALVVRYPEASKVIPNLLSQMREAIPDCIVVDYEPFIAGIELPDKNDRHVVAAAIRGNADTIVSMNTKDFPPIAFTAIKRMRLRWERPSFTASDMVDLFEKRHLVQTAAHLRDVLELI